MNEQTPIASDRLTPLLLGFFILALGACLGVTDGLYSPPAIIILNLCLVSLFSILFLKTPRLSKDLFILGFISALALAITSRALFYLLTQHPDQPWFNKAILWLNLAIASMHCCLIFAPGFFRGKVGERTLYFSLLTFLATCFLFLLLFRPGSSHNGKFIPELNAIETPPLSQPGQLFHANASLTDKRLAAAQLATKFQIGILLAGIAGSIALFAKRRVAYIGFALLLIAFFSIGVWIIRHNSPPFIDVWNFQQESCFALLHAQNPYAIDMPNIYGEGNYVYGASLMHADRLSFGYPYMPMSLYLSLPGYLIGGDFRYSQLAALTLAAGLIAFSKPSRISFIAAIMLLFTSRAFMVIELAWTEPYLVFLLALTVFCACRFPRMTPYALGLFLSSKQYLIFVLPLAFFLSGSWKNLLPMLIKAGLIWCAVTLPLVFYRPQAQFDQVPKFDYQKSPLAAFMHSAVTLQSVQPFRHDSVSYLAWRYWQYDPSVDKETRVNWIQSHYGKLSFAAAFAGIALSLWRWKPSPASFCMGITLTYFLFLAFNKQAFCNYYFFVLGAACCALATLNFKEDLAADA